MEKEKFLSSVYLIIKNYDGEILLQRRQGTKLWPGFLALPAGHIDENEMHMKQLYVKLKRNWVLRSQLVI